MPGGKAPRSARGRITVIIVSERRSITGSVVQILRIIKSFSITICYRSFITFLPEVICISLRRNK
ncbi:hypothetical protein DND01_15270 [Escherichia albertii]|nr:hypothetical protein [Escherichia albertii]EGE0301561.1 hypothetical protein [Escherichia albertii]PPQ54099.1 hypothetical protein C4623_05595 [Escherichia albertii]